MADHDPQVALPPVDDARSRREREAAQEIRQLAFRAMGVWALPGTIACIGALWLLRHSLVSAHALLADKSELISEPFMPVLLLIGVGGLIGAFLTWRVSHCTGTVGGPVSVAVAAGVLGISIACAAALPVIFSAGVPVLAWIGWAAMTTTGLGAVWVVAQVSA